MKRKSTRASFSRKVMRHISIKTLEQEVAELKERYPRCEKEIDEELARLKADDSILNIASMLRDHIKIYPCAQRIKPYKNDKSGKYKKAP